jgi:uncharacterized heparinase superfamily protein
VPVTRETRDDGAVLLRVAHDGYAKRFGIVHHRVVEIAADGKRIDGEDLFMPPDNRLQPGDAPDAFAVRFHLHPGVKASRAPDGQGVMLVLPNKDVWNFESHEDNLEIEESVYLGGQDGPRRTVQIVIAGNARKIGRVHWTLRQAPGTDAGR